METATDFYKTPRRPEFRGVREARRVQQRKGQVRTRMVLLSATFLVGGAVASGMSAAAGSGASEGEVATFATATVQPLPEEVPPVVAPAGATVVEVRSEREETGYKTTKRDDPNLAEGSERVVTKGQNGVVLTSSVVEVKDSGEETLLPGSISVEIAEPVDEVIAVGTRKEVVPSVPSAPTNVSGNRALGKEMAAARGWTGDQWACLNALWSRESGWRHTAANPYSSAYGIPQSLPGSKMASAGADWRTNPATQITWGLNYIKGRYGTPCKAWDHSERKNWY